MLRFIVDTQLPPALAYYMNSKDYDCLHTIYFPEGHLLQDSEIIKIANDRIELLFLKLVIFSTII